MAMEYDEHPVVDGGLYLYFGGGADQPELFLRTRRLAVPRTGAGLYRGLPGIEQSLDDDDLCYPGGCNACRADSSEGFPRSCY